MVGRRRAGVAWCDPEIDATRVGRNLRVALDGAAAFDCVANHLLAEAVERCAYHRGDHGPARYFKLPDGSSIGAPERRDRIGGTNGSGRWSGPGRKYGTPRSQSLIASRWILPITWTVIRG
jgi:hypothetical protein